MARKRKAGSHRLTHLLRAPTLYRNPSLREPSERLAFWLTGLCAFPAALLIGYVLHESIGASQVALFIVIAMALRDARRADAFSARASASIRRNIRASFRSLKTPQRRSRFRCR